MSELLSERFQRLPAIQQQREQEYQQQAREASSLVQRLDQTRQEAERVAIAEIETTKRLMEQQVREHPDWLKWRQQYDETAGKVRQWDAGRGATVARLQQELSRVKEQVELKGREYDSLLSLQDRVRTERASIENDNMSSKDQLGRLEAELAGLAEKESELSRDFGAYNSQVVELNEQLNELRVEIATKERENQANQQRQQAIGEQLRVHEQELSQLDNRINNVHGKRASLEQNANQLANLESQLSEQLSTLSATEAPLLQAANNNLRNAQDNLNAAIMERDRYKEQEKTFSGNLAMLNGDIHTLQHRQQSINEEINRLLEERQRIESALVEREAQLSDMQETISRQQEQEMILGEQVNKAQDVVNRSLTLLSNYTQTMREKEERAKQLQSELDRTRIERAKCSSLLMKTEEELSSTSAARRGITTLIEDLQSQLRSITFTPFEQLDERLRSLQQDLDRTTPVLNHCRDQLRLVQSELTRKRQEFLQQKQHIADNEKRLQGMPPFDDNQLSVLNQSIQQLSDQLSSINQQLAQFNTGNPHQPTLAQLQSQEAAIRSHCWEAVKQNPSSSILAQLTREAEAVMRAEAAVACVRKQLQVEQGAQDLARFHLERTPRVVLDEEAKGVMLSECTGRRPKHEIAGIVLDMCEQRHIQIAH